MSKIRQPVRTIAFGAICLALGAAATWMLVPPEGISEPPRPLSLALKSGPLGIDREALAIEAKTAGLAMFTTNWLTVDSRASLLSQHFTPEGYKDVARSLQDSGLGDDVIVSRKAIFTSEVLGQPEVIVGRPGAGLSEWVAMPMQVTFETNAVRASKKLRLFMELTPERGALKVHRVIGQAS